jgi:hypothetical protein
VERRFSKYEKLPVIQNSHPTGNNFKENLMFLYSYSKTNKIFHPLIHYVAKKITMQELK